VLLVWKVDHTGYPKLNVQRFGQRFVGKVANPDELLLFHRQRKIITRGNQIHHLHQSSHYDG
jgi:hypothetical protein